MSTLLAERLRTATRDLHRQVERAGLMPALLRGQLPRQGYLLLLRNLHTVYQALEDGLDRHAAHPGLSPLGCAALRRLPALTLDLQQLHGDDWAQALPLTDAAADYAAHLHRLARTRPALLAAHAYVRYLGDLAGGQTVGRIVSQGLALPAGQGVAFYDFGAPERVRALAVGFRQALDHIAPDEAAVQALVDEACSAFERHRDLFEQLVQPVD
jgi:heme oxygenase